MKPTRSIRARSRKVRRAVPGLVRDCIGPLGPFDRVEWFTSRGRWAAWGLWLEWSVTRRLDRGYASHSHGSRCIGE